MVLFALHAQKGNTFRTGTVLRTTGTERDLYLLANRAYTRGDRRGDNRQLVARLNRCSSRRRLPRQSPRVYTTGDDLPVYTPYNTPQSTHERKRGEW